MKTSEDHVWKPGMPLAQLTDRRQSKGPDIIAFNTIFQEAIRHDCSCHGREGWENTDYARESLHGLS